MVRDSRKRAVRRLNLLGFGAALMLALPALADNEVPAAVGARPCRIAVTGAFPTGYMGLLARYGMPRDVLLDYQMSDPDLVSKYDLVIVAGASAGARDTVLSLQRLLAKGGSVLLDCSGGGSGAIAIAIGGRTSWQAARRVQGERNKRAVPFRLVGQNNPLRDEVGTAALDPAQPGFVPVVGNSPASLVLAEYTLPRPRAGAADANEPLNPPAIVLMKQDRGNLLVCGPGVGLGMALAGANYDSLVLGMLRTLTGGRAVPQLEAEGVRLGRRQSSRTLKKTAPVAAQGVAVGPPPIPDRKPGTGAKGALPAGCTALEEDLPTEFNVFGRVEARGGEVLLNYWSRNQYLSVSLAPGGVRVTQVTAGKPRTLAVSKTGPGAGTPFAIKEREKRLMVIAGAAVATADLTGVTRGACAARGSLGEVRCQPIEPAYFSDDFMRTSDEDGGWETEGGTWKTAPVQNPDLGANPFSYKVDAAGPATALAGFPYWDEYRFAVSARPEAGKGSIGLGFYAQNKDNLLRFDARLRDAGAPPLEDGFTLSRIVEGTPTVIARAPGGLTPQQWYRVQVKAQGPWVAAFVDGTRVLAVQDTTFTGGLIALHAQDCQARFDDAQVEPSAAPETAGLRLVGYVPEFAGAIDVDSWAGPATPWEADALVPGLFWRSGAFYGDVGLRFDLPALPEGGQATLLLDGDGQTPDAGYTLNLRRVGAGAHVQLRRAGKVLGLVSAPAGKECTLSLRREGTQVVGLIDGAIVVKAPYVAGPGRNRLAFHVAGFRPRISMIKAWSANVRDYTFDSAPVDWWVGSGEWDVTNRWSCTPDWSWFGGYSADVAAIWHKQALEGNVTLDFYAGPKMLGKAGGGQGKSERFAAFNAALCGDGRNVESGYAFVAGANDAGARLLRKGQLVAENRQFQWFSRVHNRWGNIRAQKEGGRLRLLVEGQVVIEYNDPQPLLGGYAGVWTRNNAVMLPRITMYFEKATGQQLSLQ